MSDVVTNSKVPVIARKMAYGGSVNGADLIFLPADTPFGNLTLKHAKILMRIDWVNEKIEEAFASYSYEIKHRDSPLRPVEKSRLSGIDLIKGTILDPNNKEGVWEEISPTEVRFKLQMNGNITEEQIREIAGSDFEEVWGILRKSLTPDPLGHLLIAEEVIYWLRKTADELIALIYVCLYYETNGEFPKKIKVGKIGDVLDEKKGEFVRENLNGFLPFFKSLNEISNAYKHSFINTNLSIFGALELTVPALFFSKNGSVEFRNASFSAIITDFNKFYGFVMDELDRVSTEVNWYNKKVG